MKKSDGKMEAEAYAKLPKPMTDKQALKIGQEILTGDDPDLSWNEVAGAFAVFKNLWLEAEVEIRSLRKQLAKLRRVADALRTRRRYHADLDGFTVVQPTKLKTKCRPRGKVPTHYLVDYVAVEAALRDLENEDG